MIGVDPVVGVKEENCIVAVCGSKHSAQAARDIAEIRVRPVEPQMPHASTVDPRLRKPISDEYLFRGYALLTDAPDASFDNAAIFLIIWRNNTVPHVRCSAVCCGDGFGVRNVRMSSAAWEVTETRGK